MKEQRKKKLYVVMDVLCVVIGKSWTPGTELYVSINYLFFHLGIAPRGCQQR